MGRGLGGRGLGLRLRSGGRCAGLVAELLEGALVGRAARGRFGGDARCGRFEVGEGLFPVLQGEEGVFVLRLVEEDARAVEQEPGDGHADDDGDVDGLAEAGAGGLVVERVEQVDELVLFKIGVAGAGAGERRRIRLRPVFGRSGRIRGRFEDRHRQMKGRAAGRNCSRIYFLSLNPSFVGWVRSAL